MLEQGVNMIVKVKAVLVQRVCYQDFSGQETEWPVGTEILVDPEQGIALAGSDHFDIRQGEYRVLYLN